MAVPFVAEVRIFGFNFPPRGWAFCQGQLLPISQNTALFSLVGTMYGGDGKTTFALPNLQGSAPLQVGQGNGLTERFQGESGGEVAVTLLQSEIPSHTHVLAGSTATGTSASPSNAVWAAAKLGRQAVNFYAGSQGTPQAMSPLAFGVAGGGQPHNNMPPYLTLNFCIAMQGAFPPRS